MLELVHFQFFSPGTPEENVHVQSRIISTFLWTPGQAGIITFFIY